MLGPILGSPIHIPGNHHIPFEFEGHMRLVRYQGALLLTLQAAQCIRTGKSLKASRDAG